MSVSTQNAQSKVWLYATVDENGIAPDSRVSCANDAFTICDNLRLANTDREVKMGTIYRCYNLFPPEDYSMVIKKNHMARSNVSWGLMKSRVDNKKNAYYDMVNERELACYIGTKKGNAKEKKEWSDLISYAWTNKCLRRWNGYKYNMAHDISQMVLFGKGFEFAEDRTGWFTSSLTNYQILIPSRTYADLRNLGHWCIMNSYTPLEFWNKIHDRDIAKQAGWNFWACVDTLRFFTNNTQYNLTNTQYLMEVASNSINLSIYDERRIDTYELYVKEYDGSISKMIILQSYTPVISYLRRSQKDRSISQAKYREDTGFIFYRKNWAKSVQDLLCPFIDDSGATMWHEIKGFAEGIYTQCRNHDLQMNKMMDNLRVNNTLALEGGSAEATKKLKQMEWYDYMILPQDIKPAQLKLNMPTQETLNVVNFTVSEMDRSMGTFPTGGEGRRTKAESELIFAENNKTQSIERSRFGDCQTEWFQMLYRRMCATKSYGEGYEQKQEFMQFLEDNGVPEEAWQWENIDYIESNILGGAGSPANKLMIAEKTIALASRQASNPGEEEGIRDALAAMHSWQNVDRYRPRQDVDIPDQVRVISFENAGLNDPLANLENFRVMPQDNHVEHARGHIADMMISADKLEGLMQQGVRDVEMLGGIIQSQMLKGGHTAAHLNFIAQDPSKKDMMKKFGAAMQTLQKRTDSLALMVKRMAEAEAQEQQSQGGSMSKEDAELQSTIAKYAVDIDGINKKKEAKLESMNEVHDLKMEQMKERGSTQVAIATAMGNVNIENKKKSTKKTSDEPARPKRRKSKPVDEDNSESSGLSSPETEMH